MRRRTLTMIVVVCIATGMTFPLRAQNPTRLTRATRATAGATAMSGLAPTDAERSPSGQYSSADLENLRAQLVKLSNTVEQFAALAPPDLVDLDSLHQAQSQIQQMPYQTLNTLRQGLSPSKINAR